MIRREKVKMVTNRPLVVELEDAQGTETHSHYTGREYRYSCLYNGQECLLYLPPEGDQALARCGARAGDQVQLIKSSNGQFSARVFSDAHLPVEQPQQNTRMLAPQRQPVQQPPQRQPVQQQPAQHQPQNATPAPLRLNRPAAEELALCLYGAIDATIAATNYANQKGFPIQFAATEIQDLASTLYIQAKKGSRY